MNEIFKPIKNYEEIYEISNYGNVKSLQRKLWSEKNNSFSILKERILKYGKDGWGYHFIVLSLNGKNKTYYIHRLVWDVFGNKPRNGHILQIDHIDGDKTNNHIDNLQLLTQRENTTKRYAGKKKDGLPTGVYKRNKKFHAQIWRGNRLKHLGYFNTIEEASEAYQLELILIRKEKSDG